MTYSIRTRSIGWAVIFMVCAAVFIGLTMKVNAVRSEVRLAERKIIALEREKRLLETEFETRANQQQLADWNAVDFGYQAPGAAQFMVDERELADLGAPRAVGAPDPIQMALSPDEEAGSGEGSVSIMSMVSPLTGKPMEESDVDEQDKASATDEISPMPEVKTATADELDIINSLTQSDQPDDSDLSGQEDAGQ